MTVKPSVQTAPLVSHDSVTDTVRFQLRTAIVIKRRFTAEQVAEYSGVSLSAVRSYMRNEDPKEPSLGNALSIAAVLGKPAVNAILNLIGYSAAPLEDADTLQPMQIVADAMGSLATISRAAADNRIDHTEEPETTAAADMLIATVLPLSSAGRAA